jgi:hypothetical protein
VESRVIGRRDYLLRIYDPASMGSLFNGAPRRTPLACGALGAYDRAVVEAIGRRLGAGMRLVHRDRSSALMLDREPLAWRSRLTRGFAWSEGTASGRPIRSWRDAACELNAAGLVVRPGGSFVHSSVAGVAQIYHADWDGATYFASRIEPLVRALPTRCHADWEAWASILTLTHPVDGHTPFEEVRRLLPYTVVDRHRGRGRTRQQSWPWAAIEPDLDVRAGAAEVGDRLNEVLESLPPVPLTSLLSGGWDSRLVLWACARARGRGVRALTLGLPSGRGVETAIASEVAQELGVAHDVHLPPAGRYWELWVRQARTLEYQVGLPLFVTPLGERLARERGIVADGYIADTLCQTSRYLTPTLHVPDGSTSVVRELWRTLRKRFTGTTPGRMYSKELATALDRVAWRSFRRATKRVRGHPSEVQLGLHLTRSLHGVAGLPHVALGEACAIVTPCADHRVASAMLRMSPETKADAALYRTLFARDGRLGEIPSTNDPTPALRALHDRDRRLVDLGGLDRDAFAHYGRTLLAGPLAPHLSPAFRAAAKDGSLWRLIRSGRSHKALLAPLKLHLWHSDYSDVLADTEPKALLALAEVR